MINGLNEKYKVVLTTCSRGLGGQRRPPVFSFVTFLS